MHARRWGPRGHSLGVFAFMTFFATQFLHTVLGQLPELYAAVTLSLLAASLVRFGLWCYERRLPPPSVPVPAPPEGRGLPRVTTRQAIQATAGGAFALVVGQVLWHERWYWAVGATWWVFVNTASRGETLVRGFRRVLGTVIGVALGLVIAVPLDGAPVPTALLVAVCVFGIFYTAAVSYTWMMLAVTLMAGLLYGSLGVLDPGLLGLRVTETAVGALGAALAVLCVLARHHARHHRRLGPAALRCVHACTAEAAARLAGSATADPAPRVAELEVLLGKVRLSLAPLVHPLSPLRARKARARQVLALLDDCAREVRGLASIAVYPVASHDARLTAACQRVEAAVESLTTPDRAREVASPAPAAAAQPVATEPALVHLHGLERALTELAAPLRSSPRAPGRRLTGRPACRAAPRGPRARTRSPTERGPVRARARRATSARQVRGQLVHLHGEVVRVAGAGRGGRVGGDLDRPVVVGHVHHPAAGQQLLPPVVRAVADPWRPVVLGPHAGHQRRTAEAARLHQLAGGGQLLVEPSHVRDHRLELLGRVRGDLLVPPRGTAEQLHHVQHRRRLLGPQRTFPRGFSAHPPLPSVLPDPRRGRMHLEPCG